MASGCTRSIVRGRAVHKTPGDVIFITEVLTLGDAVCCNTLDPSCFPGLRAVNAAIEVPQGPHSDAVSCQDEAIGRRLLELMSEPALAGPYRKGPDAGKEPLATCRGVRRISYSPNLIPDSHPRCHAASAEASSVIISSRPQMPHHRILYRFYNIQVHCLAFSASNFARN